MGLEPKRDWLWVVVMIIVFGAIGTIVYKADHVETRQHAACEAQGKILIKTRSGPYCADPEILTRP